MGRAGHNWLVIRALVRNQFCEHVFVEIAEDFISLLVSSRPVDACIIKYEIEWDGAIWISNIEFRTSPPDSEILMLIRWSRKTVRDYFFMRLRTFDRIQYCFYYNDQPTSASEKILNNITILSESDAASILSVKYGSAIFEIIGS